MSVNDVTTEAFLLSPHLFGWPCNRPRLFEVGTLRKTCSLKSDDENKSGLASIGMVFEKCKLDCSALMIASKDIWHCLPVGLLLFFFVVVFLYLT